MTKNGRAYCSSGSGTTNLADDKVDDFASYLATILKHFKDVEGIDFKYVSPFNEPNWDWGGNSQEGCRYYNSDIKRVVDALYSELQNQGLRTEIEVPEAGEIAYLYGNSSARGDYIDSFFNTDSSNYIGDKIAHKVAGHSYFTCWPEGDDRLVGWRENLRHKLDAYAGLEYWMTEYCIYIPDGGWVFPQHRGYGNGRDLRMDPALWVARLIHYDLTVAEASAWQWWLAVSPYDYKDGLVYVSKGQTDGTYYESKMLWAVGNFSRFIRPGMRRVTVHRSDNASPRGSVHDLMVSGYYTSDGTVVVVCVNWAYEDKPVELSFPGAQIDGLIPYVTRGNSLSKDNLSAYSGLSPDDTIAIPARSIVTIVGAEAAANSQP
jgi:O-glycosyl hydrolase